MNYRNAILIPLILLLSGCTLFGPVKSNDTKYALNTLPYVPSSHGTNSILVTSTDSSTMYNSTQIAYSTNPYQISYFSKNHWAESPSKMIQQLTVQTLQNTHHYRAVLSSPMVGNYNYILYTQILELKQDFTTNPSIVRVKIRAQLTRASDNHIIAEKQFSATIATQANTPYSGVVAANRAVAVILKNIAHFCTART